MTEIFEKATVYRRTEVKSRLHETAYLNPKLTIVFEDRRMERDRSRSCIMSRTVSSVLSKDLNKNKEALHDVDLFHRDESEGITVEAAFQYVNEFHENVLGFCNNIYNAEGGTHI